MKRIKLIYVLLLAMTMPLLTACSSEDTLGNSDPTNQKGEKITVRFRVSQAGTNTMRAVGDWEDKVAEDEEMMNIWTVIAVNTNGDKVAGIWSCKPTGKEQEVDGIEEIFEAELDKGASYRFYSFANMGAAYLKGKLGFTSDIIPVPENDNEIAENINNLGNTTLTEETVNAAVVGINGNGFDPTASDNRFGAKGIPMSNVQTFANLQDESLKDLIVVRMLAKVELWLYNGKGGGSDEENLIQVNSITLTDITKNVDGNLKLLPSYKEDSPGSANSMDPGKLKPNTTTTGTVDLTISSGTASDKPVVKEDGTKSGNRWMVKAVENKYVDGTGKGEDKPIKIVFYVNESATPTTPHANPDVNEPDDFGHFFLEMDVQGDMNEYKQRYVMIDDKRNENNEVTESWNYIARNDYRIIPIVLDDYRLKVIPYDFPAIGVLPASVDEEDGVYTINFHDYGHFHLQPQVTRYSNGTLVPYGAAPSNAEDKTYWELVDDKGFTEEGCKSWTSWEDATKTTRYVNEGANAFYHIVTSADGFNLTDPKDGDEVGGVPVWYENGSVLANVWDKPKWASEWAPSATINYQPFIFGYIEDPFKGETAGNLTTDRKVYHEFTINLYKNGTGTPRQMTYRLYMILDTNQMLYPQPNRGQRIRRPHCTH